MSNQEQKPDESRPQKTNDAIAWIGAYIGVVLLIGVFWSGCPRAMNQREINEQNRILEIGKHRGFLPK